MSQRRDFNRLLHRAVRDGYGDSVTAIPTPETNAHNAQWIRDAAAGRRPRMWEEGDEPIPPGHAQVNDALRAAIAESRGEPHR